MRVAGDRIPPPKPKRTPRQRIQPPHPIPRPRGQSLTDAAQPTPVFHQEGPRLYKKAVQHNKRFAKPGPYQTKLNSRQEKIFRLWVKHQRIPFNPNAKTVDYDMRGFFKQAGPVKHKLGQHFPDTFKTPYDTTFSGESKYAKPGTPLVWRGNNLVNSKTGELVFGKANPIEAALSRKKNVLRAVRRINMGKHYGAATVERLRSAGYH